MTGANIADRPNAVLNLALVKIRPPTVTLLGGVRSESARLTCKSRIRSRRYAHWDRVLSIFEPVTRGL